MPNYLSIIVPSADSPEVLATHVRRIAEFGENIELIIVSKTPVDPTLRQEFHDAFVSLHLIECRDNSQADAINLGAELATGVALTWLNTDDQINSASVREALSFYAKGNGGILYGAARVFAPDGNVSHYPICDQITECTLAQHCGICQPAAWIGHGDWKALAGLDTNYDLAFDYDFWVRAVKSGVAFTHSSTIMAQVEHTILAKSFEKRADVFKEQGFVLLKHFGSIPPSLLDGLLGECLSPPNWYGSLGKKLLTQAGHSVRSLKLAATSSGDSMTVSRIDQDIRLEFLNHGIAIGATRDGHFNGALELRALSNSLPCTVAIDFGAPLDDGETVSMIDQDDWTSSPSLQLGSEGLYVFRVEQVSGREIRSLRLCTDSKLRCTVIGLWTV